MKLHSKLILTVLFIFGLIATAGISTAADNSTGNRIWDANENVSRDYTWTAMSYSGFYYDLDTNESSETLTINLDSDSRNVNDGDLEYTTKPIETEFEYNEFGSYEVIGFMAERYFAGYTDNTTFTDEDVSLMSDGQLAKVLTDTDDRESFFAGSELELEEGYSIHIIEVDINGDSVFVELRKDGDQIDSGIVSGGDVYTYEKDLGSADDVPIIAVNFDNIFRGTETNAVFVEGIFQISEDYTEVDDGDNYGKMEVDSVTSNEITMSNDDSITLGQGDDINIMGRLNFIVADDSTLRFGPYVDISESGTYELRGTVTENENFEWTPLNFEGFYYDIDEGLKTESIEVTRDKRNIDDGDLLYTTEPAEVEFEFGDFGSYEVIGFMAEKYFAGYTEDNTTFSDEDVSLMSDGQLSKVLIDDDETKSTFSGSSLVLEEGYRLRIVEVDLEGDSVFVELHKDGEQIDSGVVSGGDVYTYEKDVGSADDVPIIAVNFEDIFRGSETNAVFVEGIFQISEDYTEVDDGDNYGKMEVDSVSSNEISMSNDDSITLGQDDTISIMGNINFKVADDSDTVRYYPFVEVTTGPGDMLTIDLPDTITQDSTVTITIESRGAAVQNAVVMVDDENIGTTTREGTIEYTPEDTGTFTVTAEKQGFVSASKEIEVIGQQENRMSVDISPDEIFAGDIITITVTEAIGNEPIENAEVTYDDESIGDTSADGTINYTTNDPGVHKVTASKDGYQDGEENIEILESGAQFSISDLNISPSEVEAGNPVSITVNATNIGNMGGDYTIELMVNGTMEDSEQINLDAGNSTTVEFTHTENEPGNYSVEVDGQTGTYTVTPSGVPGIGVFGLIAVLTIAYLFRKRQK
ncbi:S-layer-related duplication domain protein [Methanohalobium evestigatum Z-7303]|uniref:S-layer-related duplication domain protein n=1 Tax=Methanohalobium evestigatum (strain ATCC BAA-1072 / DSM 3721 / NBRC 107634 / OCM 161 / Z-7303) TaxID=644295 RepID=D7E8A7_METEZ|nr:S-layer protein domain-containing protein [Methanohalobium evestigatum]ADI73449.1 S-layer-related duplication domain protein [Methanohalobium evestigatum Z-7303]